MSGSEVSGVDLARQALLAAREAARKNGAARLQGMQVMGAPHGMRRGQRSDSVKRRRHPLAPPVNPLRESATCRAV